MKFAQLVTLCGAVTVAVAAAGMARGASAAYLGRWTIVGATKAPWADPAHPLDPSEPARLQGQHIVFKPTSIAGPPPFPCPRPHYQWVDFTPDLLFQGAFGEMQSKNKSADPTKIAASLGFPAPGIETLETGCEIDFHFADGATAKAGLNDYVYTLKKQ